MINRRKGVFPTSLLKKLLQQNKTFSTEACNWGISMENVAMQKYETQTQIIVEKCGFIVNPKWAWQGCSPDGIVNELKAVEVKCPFSKKDMTIDEACMNKSFSLQMCDGTPKLKQSNIYYLQCQGIMAITDIKNLNLIVYTEKSLHIETIKFQNDNI